MLECTLSREPINGFLSYSCGYIIGIGESRDYISVILIIFGLKKLPVFPLTCRKELGWVGRKIFLFFV